MGGTAYGETSPMPRTAVRAFLVILGIGALGLAGLSCNPGGTDGDDWPYDGGGNGEETGAPDTRGRDVPEPIPDTEPSDGPGTYSRPNQCAGDDRLYAEQVEFIGEGQSGTKIPWKVFGAGSRASGSFSGIWKGTGSRNSAVTFDCPATASPLGLNCETDRVVRVDPDSGDWSGAVEFALSIPLDGVDWPSEGTEVEVTFQTESTRPGYGDTGPPQSNDRRLVIRSKPSSEYVLVVTRAEASPANAVPDVSRAYGPLGVTLPEAVDDPSTADCITRAPCPRLWRIEQAVVTSDETRTVSPGSAADIDASGATYRFWHLASIRRGGNLPGWPSEQCADQTPPEMGFAFARTSSGGG